MHLNNNRIRHEKELMQINQCLLFFFFFFFLVLIPLNCIFRSSSETRQTSLGKQIDFVLSIDYDRVKKSLQRYDPSHCGTISGNELRTIIEDLLEYTLKADEFYQLLKRIPLDEHGRVIYQDYFKKVLDRSLAFQKQDQNLAKFSCFSLLFG